jgi:hypothetical protein
VGRARACAALGIARAASHSSWAAHSLCCRRCSVRGSSYCACSAHPAAPAAMWTKQLQQPRRTLHCLAACWTPFARQGRCSARSCVSLCKDGITGLGEPGSPRIAQSRLGFMQHACLHSGASTASTGVHATLRSCGSNCTPREMGLKVPAQTTLSVLAARHEMCWTHAIAESHRCIAESHLIGQWTG